MAFNPSKRRLKQKKKKKSKEVKDLELRLQHAISLWKSANEQLKLERRMYKELLILFLLFGFALGLIIGSVFL